MKSIPGAMPVIAEAMSSVLCVSLLCMHCSLQSQFCTVLRYVCRCVPVDNDIEAPQCFYSLLYDPVHLCISG